MKSKYLSRSDDDIVDGDEDELHKEADESHHHESDSRTERHLREFCNPKDYHPGFIKFFFFFFGMNQNQDSEERIIEELKFHAIEGRVKIVMEMKEGSTFAIGLVAALDEENAVLGQISQGIEH